MAWMETDYSKHTYFRWKIKWRLEHLGALGIMDKTAPLRMQSSNVFVCLFVCLFAGKLTSASGVVPLQLLSTAVGVWEGPVPSFLLTWC